ncbi:MAG: hypothetical protein ABIJ30_12430 [bacterium]
MKNILWLIIWIICIWANIGYAEPAEKIYPLKQTKEAENITIVYTGSTNGYLESCNCKSNPFGGLVRRAACFKKLRKEMDNLIFVDSGDLFPAHPQEIQINYCLRVMELLEYDAVVLGDQEFVLGCNFIHQKIKKNKLPFIVSNLSLCTERLCIPLAPPCVIKQVGKYTVGIIGVISKDAFAFFPKEKIENLDIHDPVNALKSSIAMLKKEDQVDLIVVLSHMGYKMDQEMAERVEGIGIIVGGHSQVLLQTPVRIGDTVILQPGEKGQFVGVFTINMKNRRMNNRMIPLNKDIPDDKGVRRLIDRYKKEVEEKTKRLEF